MAEQVINVANDGTFPSEASFDNPGDKNLTIQFVNGFDVSADFVVNGSYQGDDFTDAVQLSSTTVSSGSTDSVDVSGAWDQIQVSIADPTAASGSAQVYRHTPR